MPKKRKLNSKNPKYWKEETTEKPIVEKRLIANKGKVKIYGVFEKSKN